MFLVFCFPCGVADLPACTLGFFSCRVAFKNNTDLVPSVNLQEFLMPVSGGRQIFLRGLGSQEIL